MSSQCKLKYCLATIVAFFALPQPLVFAQSVTELNQISTENSPKLTNIGANDFFPNGQQSSTVTSSDGFYTPLSFNSDTTRVVKWEMRVRKSDLNLDEPLEIEYELVARNTEPNKLNKQQAGPDPELPVVVTPLPLETEEDCTSETEGECETLLIKGAAQLTINISQFREAGEYRGKLSVCLKNKDGECI